jgi:uncharacterized protein YbjT (DUF2867 family)
MPENNKPENPKPENVSVAVAGATGRVGSHVVDVLRERGYGVVPISRSHGIDVITGDGLAAALTGVHGIIDAATGPSPEEAAATEFFATAARNLQEYGGRAGVERLLVVSIIGSDRFTGGYGAAKVIHENIAQAGPVSARILRASQFHEFVAQLVEWGTQGEVAYLPKMRTQPVAARAVAETLVDLVTASAGWPAPGARARMLEIAGPKEARLADLANLLVARRGDVVKIEEVSDTSDPTHVVYESGALLPGPDAILAGPTFEDWLDATRGARTAGK